MEALLEVLSSLETADILEHVEVTIGVSACLDETVPVDALKAHVGIILLEREVHGAVETNVWSLDSVHVFTSHLELREIEVFWEHLHLAIINLIINFTATFYNNTYQF